MSATLMAACGDCEGGKVYVPGFAGACNGRRPTSECDGDCPGCGRWDGCQRCLGTGQIIDADVACVICSGEGVAAARLPGSTLCGECVAQGAA
jgi:hypothetical protein